jgi:hypothetical protein
MQRPLTQGEDTCPWTDTALPNEKYPDRQYSCEECGQPAVRTVTLYGNGSPTRPTVEHHLCTTHAPAMM